MMISEFFLLLYIYKGWYPLPTGDEYINHSPCLWPLLKGLAMYQGKTRASRGVSG